MEGTSITHIVCLTQLNKMGKWNRDYDPVWKCRSGLLLSKISSDPSEWRASQLDSQEPGALPPLNQQSYLPCGGIVPVTWIGTD